jgi:hypothetical protein
MTVRTCHYATQNTTANNVSRKRYFFGNNSAKWVGISGNIEGLPGL